MYERIKDMRVDRDINQKKIAEYLQIHQTTYSDYEIGNLNIPVPMLIKIAAFYGTSIDYLLGLTDETKPYPRSKKK